MAHVALLWDDDGDGDREGNQKLKKFEFFYNLIHKSQEKTWVEVFDN